MTNTSDNIQDDEALWYSFIEGNNAAFEQLFTRYYPTLLRYGRKFSLDTDFIKDSIQDLFSELWQRRTHLNTTPSVKHYLYKSLRRKMIRISGNRHQTDELTEETYQFAVTLSPEQILLDDEFSTQLSQQMNHWLTFLTPRQREAIYHKFYHDLDYEEISFIMSISNHTVRNLIYEALKLLRSRFISLLIMLVSFY